MPVCCARSGAAEFAKGEIQRLLKGGCEMWEFAMTGGLWRVTGNQLQAAANGASLNEDVSSPSTQCIRPALMVAF